MSESANVLETGRYEARVKIILATDMIEADRQREEWNLGNKAQKSQRETAGLNVNEPIRSIVISARSNAVIGCAETVFLWRRQYQISINPVMLSGHPGVTGLACGEGYSREDGRDCIAPVRLTMHVKLIKSPDVDSHHVNGSREVRGAISRSETPSNGMQPVRQDHSRDETPVMGTDSKGPGFYKSFANSSGPQIRSTVKGRA